MSTRYLTVKQTCELLALSEMNVIEDLEDRFVESVAAARQALNAARADPWVKGSRGQLVAHPGFGVAAKLDLVAVGSPGSYGWPGKQPAKRPLDELDELAARRRGDRHE